MPRYPGSYPVGGGGHYRDFDPFTLVLGKVNGDEQAEKTQRLEGRVYTVLYNNPEGRSLTVLREVSAALPVLKRVRFQSQNWSQLWRAPHSGSGRRYPGSFSRQEPLSLFKLGIKVSERTIQKYMRDLDPEGRVAPLLWQRRKEWAIGGL